MPEPSAWCPQARRPHCHRDAEYGRLRSEMVRQRMLGRILRAPAPEPLQFRPSQTVPDECRFEVLAQRDLPAPIIWCYSCQAAIQEHFGQGKLLERVFEPRNVAALGCFAACDVLAILIGVRTSNQQAVARR